MIILANNKKIPVINIPVNNFVNTGYQFRQYWLMILSILVFDFKGKQTEDSKNMGVLEICLHQISNVKKCYIAAQPTHTETSTHSHTVLCSTKRELSSSEFKIGS